MLSPVIVGVELISALVAASLLHSTLKPCRESGIPYLMGIPAGFGLLAVAFAASTLELLGGGLVLDAIFLFLQTYGLLFIALTYARRTRLRIVGESFSIELAIPIVVTILVLGYAMGYENLAALYAVPLSMNLSLRGVMALATVYLVYETARNWALTQKENRNPEVKPKDDFKEKHPNYRNFSVDPLAPLTEPQHVKEEPTPSRDWRDLLAS